MSRSGRATWAAAARTAGYALVGFLGAGLLWLGSVAAVSERLQPPVYDALYLTTGPWTATETAIVVVMVLVVTVAVSVPVLAVIAHRGHRDRVPVLALGVAVLLAVVVAGLLGGAVVGVSGFPAALGAYAAVAIGVPGLVYDLADDNTASGDEGAERDGDGREGEGRLARLSRRFAGGLPALAGTVPVLLLSLILLGFGLGWGGGYDVRATEVPASQVEGAPDTTFADAPAFRAALFEEASAADASYCEVDDDGLRTCHLELRLYEFEDRAARVLARRGVRCRFQGATAAPDPGSFTAEVDGRVYRVTCVTYGD